MTHSRRKVAEGVRVQNKCPAWGRCAHPLLMELQVSLPTGKGYAERKEVGGPNGNEWVNFLTSPEATGNILVDMPQKLSLL